MKAVPFIVCALSLWLAACGSSGSSSGNTGRPEPTGAKIRTADEWLEATTKDNGYVQDESGRLVPKSNKRSSFESQRKSVYGEEKFGKKDFKTESFAKKSWWGQKEVERQSYAGQTDGSRFHEGSALGGKSAREGGMSRVGEKNYKTEGFATNQAREASGTRLAKPSDAETDIRREVFKAPSVTDWKGQRTLSVSQLREALGKN